MESESISELDEGAFNQDKEIEAQRSEGTDELSANIGEAGSSYQEIDLIMQENAPHTAFESTAIDKNLIESAESLAVSSPSSDIFPSEVDSMDSNIGIQKILEIEIDNELMARELAENPSFSYSEDGTLIGEPRDYSTESSYTANSLAAKAWSYFESARSYVAARVSISGITNRLYSTLSATKNYIGGAVTSFLGVTRGSSGQGVARASSETHPKSSSNNLNSLSSNSTISTSKQFENGTASQSPSNLAAWRRALQRLNFNRKHKDKEKLEVSVSAPLISSLEKKAQDDGPQQEKGAVNKAISGAVERFVAILPSTVFSRTLESYRIDRAFRSKLDETPSFDDLLESVNEENLRK